MFRIGLVEDLVLSAVSNDETSRRKGEQLALNCACAAVDMPCQLPDKEVRVWFGVESGEKPTPRPSEQQVSERRGMCTHYENDCTQHEYESTISFFSAPRNTSIVRYRWGIPQRYVTAAC